MNPVIPKREYWKKNLNFMPLEMRGRKHEALEIIIVDDFLSDPDSVREQLLSLNFAVPPNPERDIISSNCNIPDDIRDLLKPRIEHTLNKAIAFHPRSKCALTFEHVPLNAVCHVDGGDGMIMFDWTVVIYLNPPGQCDGGTDFFQHVKTGDIYNKRGYRYYLDDFKDPAKWRLLERVPMRFNRALFCPAWRFHSIAFSVRYFVTQC